jgi:hypothetical protein
MYQIDKDKNRISQVDQKSFSELGFREREHLQEWIAYNPSVFGEDLLIIQKEFSNFDDTNERLDLLALDKDGKLVIIENKLDDSGKDVTWQSLKYVSYCSKLSKENIRSIYQDYLDKYFSNKKAEDNLVDFFEGKEYEDIILNIGFSQRIILVASNFRKEVTSTVLWLMNYKLKIQCFKTTLSAFDSQFFINFEQIIPTKDAEDYMIGMADKVQEEIQTQSQLKNRYKVRKEFWKFLLDKMNKKSKLFQTINPSKEYWIGKGSGVRGVRYQFVATKKHATVEIYIDRGNKDENKQVFDDLSSKKIKLEQKFGDAFSWERLDSKKVSRIKFENDGNIYDEDKWEEMSEFMTSSMIKLEDSFSSYLAKVNK